MQPADALQQIAGRFGLSFEALERAYHEDTHTGWDAGAGEWPVGSLWAVEGRILYALVRVLEPAHLLELGTGYGCSATHLLTAMQANGSGMLSCVDNGGDPTAVGRIGSMIPTDLRASMIASDQNIDEFIQAHPGGFDFVFEDGIHSPTQVHAVWSARERLLAPGGMLVSHDAMHFIVGQDVRWGIEQSGVSDALYLSIEPSDCGLAIWQKEPLGFGEGFASTQLSSGGGAAWPDAGDYSAYLDSCTVAELKAIIKEKGIETTARRKADLIAVLEGNI